MKVDQYRIQKSKEYSFLVPAGMDLGDFDEPEKGYLEIYQPYVLEQQDVELETIVQGSEYARATEELLNYNLAGILTIPMPSEVESNEDGID